VTDEPLHWTPARVPQREALRGDSVRLEPVDVHRHRDALYAASHHDGAAPELFMYLPYGPFTDVNEFTTWLEACAASGDPLFFTVVDRGTNRPAGMASFMRMVPEHGVIEIGHIWFGPVLQNTPAATEALFFLLRHALDDLGYRRMEWKCNALNEASRRAAVRLGFAFEGIFYQHMIAKGRNRDTAWYSILDGEWPSLRANFETWLAPENFDAAGRQRISLSALTRATRESDAE